MERGLTFHLRTRAQGRGPSNCPALFVITACVVREGGGDGGIAGKSGREGERGEEEEEDEKKKKEEEEKNAIYSYSGGSLRIYVKE